MVKSLSLSVLNGLKEQDYISVLEQMRDMEGQRKLDTI